MRVRAGVHRAAAVGGVSRHFARHRFASSIRVIDWGRAADARKMANANAALQAGMRRWERIVLKVSHKEEA
jgi:hypothetical protein